LLTPVPMEKVYIVVPIRFEDKVLEEIGKLGFLHISGEYTVAGTQRVENVEVCENYLKLYERINQVLSSLPRPEVKKSLIDSIREAFKTPEKKEPSIRVKSLSEIEKYVETVGARLDLLLSRLDEVNNAINSLLELRRKLEYMKKYGLRLDQVGRFRHIFVKAGFMHTSLVPRLKKYIIGTKIVYTAIPAEEMQVFLVITGPVDEEEFIKEPLMLLNFEEFTFPEEVSRDPAEALAQVEEMIEEKTEEKKKIEEEIRRLGENFRVETEPIRSYILDLLSIERARSNLRRTKTMSIIYGWIPEAKRDLLKEKIMEVTDGVAYMSFEKPEPGERVPVYFENKGLFKCFEVFTNILGTPSYTELNPTPFFAILFVTMFGMMFGDVGEGAVILGLGLLFSRLKKGLLSFSANTMRKIGVIYALCGLSSIFFGFLYGEFFLTEAFHPLFLSPMHDMWMMMKIALVFGIFQIVLAIILNITNRLLSREPLKAIFDWRGILGLIYYGAGIILALKFIESMSLSVFISPDALPFTIIVLLCLALIFLSPLIESMLKKERAPLSERLMEGFSEGLEAFIAFIANSISYVRLAAFALAHGVFGMLASIFASSIGSFSSLLLMNILVIILEGFASTIQSMRLMYYEFSTKFYIGGGVRYRPFKIHRLG